MIKWILKKLGLMPVREFNKFIDNLDKDNPIPLPSTTGEITALMDPKEEAYKVAVFKKVFNNKKGRLVLDFLKATYTPAMPNFDNSNVEYYMAGKLRVVTEINMILNKRLKKKENK